MTAAGGRLVLYDLVLLRLNASGVQFDSNVTARSTSPSGEASLELRLPLTVADLSTFSSRRDSLLFPHISQVRGALVGGCQTDADNDNDGEDWGPQLRSTKRRIRHFENTG